VTAADDNDRTVRTFLDALERKDWDAALALVTADVEYDNVPFGKVIGPDAMRSLFSRGVTKRADRLDWVVIRQAAQGDLVFNERLDRFRIDGAWLEIQVAGVFEFRDGKIALWRDYFDLDAWRRQSAQIDGLAMPEAGD
jgi:limonene-1,2-epoxide hydrolase